MTVRRSIDFRPNGTWGFADNKTRRSRRPVKLHSDVTELLGKHKTVQEAERIETGQRWASFDLVFCTRVGTPIERHNVKRAFRRIIDATNVNVEDPRRKLPTIRLYDLRHTFATLALAAGVLVKVVSEQLGHAGVAATLDVYSHVLPHMQDAAADRVEAFITRPRRSASRPAIWSAAHCRHTCHSEHRRKAIVSN